jgi:PIN domain nuclease of toxin-antitoxin system
MDITFEDAKAGGELPGPLRDPFDRLLIAQASRRRLPLVTTDRFFQRYDVQIIW